MNLNDALKYQQRNRLTVAQIHPSLRFTRLGAVLREHATAPDEVGALAHSALTSDHSQPLELMPLHLLKDRMQEEPDHPLAKEFNWERVPEGVQLDALLRMEIDKHNNFRPDSGHTSWISPMLVRSGGSHPPQIEAIRKIRNQIHSLLPGLAPNDVDHSATRLQLQEGRDFLSRGDDEETHTGLSRTPVNSFNKSETFPDRSERVGH